MPSVIGYFLFVITTIATITLASSPSTTATVQVPPPPAAPQVDGPVTPTTLTLKWRRGDDEGGGFSPVDAYEVQYKPMFEPDWVLVNSTTSEHPSLLGYLDPLASYRDVQILSVRVDQGHSITGGYFQLSFNFDGRTTIDPVTNKVITRPIPYNAKASDVKAALEELENIQNVQVRRCDEAGGAGGADGWLGGCPYGVSGGYSWHIVFDPPKEPRLDHRTGKLIAQTLSPDLPLLSVHNLQLVGPWTGPGAQVMVERAGQGLLHRSLCSHAVCHLNVTSLLPSTSYSFRLRSRNAMGWSDYSHTTDYVSTAAYSVPPPPLGPTLQSAAESGTALTVRVSLGSDGSTIVPPITHYEVQIRAQGADIWQSLSQVSAIPGIFWVTTTATGLQPNTTYYFRARAWNDAGSGPYGGVSAPCTTLGHSPMVLAAPFIQPHANITSDSVEISWLGVPGPSGSRYDLRYRQGNSENPWVEIRDILPAGSQPLASPQDHMTLTAAVVGLEPYTSYVFQVRQWWMSDSPPPLNGQWSNSSSPIRTLDGLEPFTLDRPPSESKEDTFLVTSSLDAVAMETDADYVYGVGLGGTKAQAGGDGMVVIACHVYGTSELSRTYFFFTGGQQRYQVPRSVAPGSWQGYIIVKAWGGGGGSSRGDHLTNNSDSGIFSHGGPGGYAQARLRAHPGDILTVNVGGGGQGSVTAAGGAGGYNGGRKGGSGDFGGGGGGGMSEVWRDGKLLIVAAGGGGGGSTDLCCSHGGGGGGVVGQNGTEPVFDSRKCDDEICVDEDNQLDFLDGAVQIDYGTAPNASYAVRAGGGGGGTAAHGGEAGVIGSYAHADGGDLTTSIPEGVDMTPLGSVIGSATSMLAGDGSRYEGGQGADGKRGGGGGGAGIYGGGGGGSSMYAAGGGGGAGFIDYTEVYVEPVGEAPAVPEPPRVTHRNHSAVTLEWEVGMSILGEEVVGWDVDISRGTASEESTQVATVLASASDASISPVYTYTATGLAADTDYRFRLRSFSRKMHSTSSLWVETATLPAPTNSWVQILPRRVQRSRGGKGINAPVLSKPHNNPIVQTRTEGVHTDPLEYTDPPSSTKADIPSPRQGHSIAAIDGVVYLFGGYTEGYDCSLGITDTSSLGQTPAGIPLDKCRLRRGISHELWRYDPVTTTWEEVDSLGSSLPVARERHSASVVDGKMYIFGGLTTRLSGSTSLTTNRTYLYDLWEMDPGVRTTYTTSGTVGLIPEGTSSYLTATVTVPGDQCIVDMEVQMDIKHPCTRQLELSLWGPGPNTHDAYVAQYTNAYPVKLFVHRDGTLYGCGSNLERMAFNDTAPRSLHDCCHGNPFKGAFRPEDRLSSFHHVPARGQWRLQVYDNLVDGRNGSVLNWNLSFVLQACKPSYMWTQIIPATATRPPARFQHTAIAIDSSLFIWGGNDDGRLIDLWRIDLAGATTWVELKTPSSLSTPTEFIGRALALTPWGLLAYGGYTPKINDSAASPYGAPYYGGNVWLQDVVTERWIELPTEGWTEPTPPHLHRQEGVLLSPLYPELHATGPVHRYLTAVAFVPQASRKALGDHHELSFSSYSSMSPFYNMSLLLFGGHDGMRYLSDTWELRLDALTAYNGLQTAEERRDEACRWRLVEGGAKAMWNTTCAAPLTTAATSQQGSCRPHDIMLQAWCRKQYQTMANL